MAEHIQVTLHVRKVRALNDVQFAWVVDSLAKGIFEVKHKSNPRLHYRFAGADYELWAGGYNIKAFIGDVQTLVGEHAQYEREQVELRRANEHFSHDHVRLSASIAELTMRLDQSREAILTWEQRHTNVTEKLAARNLQVDNLVAQLTAKDTLLNAAGQDLEALREKCDQLGAVRENQRNTIIGFQQRVTAFDEEATRLRAELAEERAARRQEAANAAREIALLREDNESFALSTVERDCREANNARDYLLEIQRLRGELSATNAALNDVREELGRCAVPRAGSVKIEFNRDGSVVLDTGDGPVTINGNVSVTGEVSA